MPLLLPLDIVNAACARIGEDALQSLEDETIAGQAVSLIYEELVGFNIAVYPFSFARKIQPLSRIADAVPLSGWLYVFDLPAERIGPPIYVTDDITDPGRRFSRYSLVESQVHADCEPLHAQIKFLPSPNLWSATFRTVTITALASRLSFALASDRATMETLRNEAYGTPQDNFRGGQMRAAINEDSFSVPPRRQDRDNNPLTKAWRS
jgi:hypothetical protein